MILQVDNSKTPRISYRHGFSDPYQLDRHSSHHYQPTRQSQGITVIPEVIRNFLTYFQQVIADRNVAQIQVSFAVSAVKKDLGFSKATVSNTWIFGPNAMPLLWSTTDRTDG